MDLVYQLLQPIHCIHRCSGGLKLTHKELAKVETESGDFSLEHLKLLKQQVLTAWVDDWFGHHQPQGRLIICA